jgi:hypothetical protein
VVKVNLKLGTATVLWDADGDGEWDDDEEEVPLAFLRSVTGKEDMNPEKVRRDVRKARVGRAPSLNPTARFR